MTITTVLTAAALGLALALSTGIRAFLAPFFLSLAAWFGWVSLPAPLHWMATGLAVGTFAFAIVLEVAADKIPAVDHAMDALHVFLKPVAGTLVAMSMMTGVPPIYAGVAALCTGGAIAGVTHVKKAAIRLGSTASTAGTLNPVISVLEDALALGLAGAATWGVHALRS